MDDLQPLGRLIHAIRPWLDEVVVVGGWAHRLFWLHDAAHPPAHAALRTLDADLVFSDWNQPAGDIGAALRAAGFSEELAGEHRPPTTHYHLGDTDGFYAEFLVPLRGSTIKRAGEEDATLRAAGVTAQRLRHVDVLLAKSWTVTLPPMTDILAAPTLVLVANPISFIAQKLLIGNVRPLGKRAQDTLYIHDTIELFGGSLERLSITWREDVRPAMTNAVASEIEELAASRFAVIDDVIRSAARTPADRSLEPDVLRRTCALGLTAIFGPHA